MTITDEDLNDNWVPSGKRPQSAMAQSFQQDLNRLFNLDGALEDMSSITTLDERKENVGKGSQELADLNAKIREMEWRLKKSTPETSNTQATIKEEPSEDSKTSESRPGTPRASKQAPGSGNMPPTPGASEDGDGA